MDKLQKLGELSSLSLDLVPNRRGAAEVHRLWLRWKGPLKLMSRQRIEAIEAGLQSSEDES